MLFALCAGNGSGLLAQESGPTEAQVDFFESRIRPVLVEQCYECHNSADTAEAGFSLDHRAALRSGSDSGDVLGGGGEPSLLLGVIRHEIPGLEMPEGGDKLNSQTIRDFEKWVAMGAPDPRDHPPSAAELEKSTAWESVRAKRKKWWSFQPIQVADAHLTEPNASKVLDELIAAKLASSELARAQRAAPAQLVRRVAFALTGLPPSPEEVQAFADAPSVQAYEQFVDKLLSSPQFGERWARHWMDWIRYAESHGSEGDPRLVGAEQYRDYLIRALNKDVPYDQLVREHIAGDLLQHPRLNVEQGLNESLIGTAHWRMVFHGFSPTDALDEKVRFTDDAVNVFSKAFLGLTVSCARCHNHKFDPISQADYYAIFGILSSTRPGRAAIELDENRIGQVSALKDLKREIRGELVTHWLQALQTKSPELASFEDPRRLQAFLGDSMIDKDTMEPRGKVAESWVAAKNSFTQFKEQQQAFENQGVLARWSLSEPTDYNSWFVFGDGLDRDSPTKAGEFTVARGNESVLAGIFPAGAISHSLSDKYGARFESPSLPLNGKYKAWIQVAGRGQSMARYVVQDYPRNGTIFPVTNLDTDWRWQAYDLDYWDGDSIHLELSTAMDAPLLVKSQPRSWFGIRQAVVMPQGSLAPPTKDLSYLALLLNGDEPENWSALSQQIRRITREAVQDWRDGKTSDAQAIWLSKCLKYLELPNQLDENSRLGSLVLRYRDIEQSIPIAQRVPTVSEWQGSDSPLFERGDHRKPAQNVPRRFLEVFDATPYQTALSGRAELAESVLSETNPLTARVIVNRVWHHLFGQGLVGTPDNFGRLGEKPSHPELLDYLAYRMRAKDQWSLKQLIRNIVLSETFCQASTPTDASQLADPSNKLLSHYSIRRLEAEAIRDAMLWVSGDLDETPFGAPVSGNSSRRSVYVNVLRNRLDPLLTAFDAPIPFSTKGKRDATNVPAQSLMLMNNSQVTRWAKAFADASGRAEHDEDRDEERIRWMWWKAFGRQASDEEIERGRQFVVGLRAQYDALNQSREVLQQQEQRVAEAKESLFQEWKRSQQGDSAEEKTEQIRDMLSPLAEWSFDSLEDSVGGLKLSLQGSARLDSGELVLDGKGYAMASSPLAQDLQEKSLEVMVQLEQLEQRGGGLFSIQSRDGVLFDSIVYGEQRPQHWIAGSNNFRRTQDFNGSAERELDEPIHLLVIYQADGTIRAYRNGEPYGASYKTSLQTFKRDNSSVLFGLRHGNAVAPGRMARARILHARLYDRALAEEEVGLAVESLTGYQSIKRLRAQMPAQEQAKLLELEAEQMRISQKRKTLGQPTPPGQAWSDLAHMIFNSKEFIYVR